MNIVFMGTPDFAVPSLEALIKQKNDIMAVVTQPDRPVGRKRVVTPPPIKKLAVKNDIPVFQPEKVKDKEFIKTLSALKPDLIVVVAFGQILPRSIIELPTIGCINVHASLLPKYRGAAPIQWSIINGESHTGVTTMWMDEGLDTGDMFLQESIPINKSWTSEDLFKKLSDIGGQLLLATIDHIKSGDLIRIPQDHSKTTYASMLNKESGKIDWLQSAEVVHNLIRGTYPWPGAYTIGHDAKIKIWEAEIYPTCKSVEPGKFLGAIKNEGFLVGTGDGALLIKELQVAGRNRMKALDYLAGHNMEEGESFADARF